jgi:hypothetical protein
LRRALRRVGSLLGGGRFGRLTLGAHGVITGHYLGLAMCFGVTGGFRSAQDLSGLLCFSIIVGTAAFCVHGVLHTLASLLASLSP